MVEEIKHSQKWEQVASEAKETPVEPAKALAIIKDSVKQASE